MAGELVVAPLILFLTVDFLTINGIDQTVKSAATRGWPHRSTLLWSVAPGGHTLPTKSWAREQTHPPSTKHTQPLFSVPADPITIETW